MAVAVPSLLIMSLLALSIHFTDAVIGVCYGRLGSNLPMGKDVVNLCKSDFIRAMRLYDPDLEALQALKGSTIKLMLDVPNEKLESLASDPTTAEQWVRTYVVPFASTIKYIVVGNGIHPTDRLASSVLLAMENVRRAVFSFHDLRRFRIRVSTSIDTSLIQNSYPPSNGEFSNTSYITPIIDFLRYTPLLVNVYPYFTYVSNKESISLDYALFTSNGTVVTDPNNGKNYQNLFDAIVDSVYAALKKAGAPSYTRVVVSETGWPSDGGDAATVDNARTYYRNLVKHVRNGTPLKPYRPIETYLFEMFDEDMKPGAETQRHFGLYTPDNHFKYGKKRS